MTAMFYGRINNPDWKLPWYDIRKLRHNSSFRLAMHMEAGTTRLSAPAYADLSMSRRQDGRR